MCYFSYSKLQLSWIFLQKNPSYYIFFPVVVSILQFYKAFTNNSSGWFAKKKFLQCQVHVFIPL